MTGWESRFSSTRRTRLAEAAERRAASPRTRSDKTELARREGPAYSPPPTPRPPHHGLASPFRPTVGRLCALHIAPSSTFFLPVQPGQKPAAPGAGQGPWRHPCILAHPPLLPWPPSLRRISGASSLTLDAASGPPGGLRPPPALAASRPLLVDMTRGLRQAGSRRAVDETQALGARPPVSLRKERVWATQEQGGPEGGPRTCGGLWKPA